ncbi:MAG: cytochrome c biogenesis protein ResB [Bacteriovoracaceae bacterium]
MLNKLLNFFKELSSLKYFFWSLLWLMFLVVVGTLAQKDIGLYLAQNRFFSSWILWIWYIPFPGGTAVLALIFLGLLSQLIFKTNYNSKKLGIAITHLGAFLLIFGGLLTGLFSYEGNMVLPEGSTSNYFEDYHKLEVAIVNTDNKDKDITTSFGESWIYNGSTLEHASLPFKIKITKFCRNSAFNKREGDSGSYVGFAKNFAISEINLAKEDVENRAGIEFDVVGSAFDGKYALIEALPIQQTLTSKEGKNYFIEIRHKRHRLPFSIQLIDFEKKVYAATEQAKSFKSVVNLIEGDLSQRTVIQMNEPLRYKGYTLYQASFAQEGKQETSVLTVVKNVGRLFPYISSIIICFGILIHLVFNFSVLFKKNVGAKHD